MPRPKATPRVLGKISVTDAAGRYRARARLCLPDLDRHDHATGLDAFGELVYLEASGATEEAARSALEALVAPRLRDHSRRHFQRLPVKVASVSVGQAARDAVAKMEADEQIGASSGYLYRRHITKHLEPSALGSMLLNEAGPAEVSEYLRVITRTTGTATAKMGRAVLNAAFGSAVLTQQVQRNPVRDASVHVKPKVRVSALDHHRALNKEERLQLAWAVARDQRAIDLDVRDMILAGIALGARIGELSALRWCDIEFVADGSAKVTLAATVDWVPGQGLVRRKPKTEASVRTIPVSRRIAALLRRRAGGSPLSPVFPAPGRWAAEGRFRDRSNTTKVIRAVFDRAGFPWLSMHGLRRSAITFLTDIYPMRVGSDFAGHRELRTTQIYVGRGAVLDCVADVL